MSLPGIKGKKELNAGRRGRFRRSGFVTAILVCLLYLTFRGTFSYASPLQTSEKFVYDLTWAGIKAGTASLQLKNDGDKIRIISTAQSAKWVSVFYTVDDKVESTLSQNPSRSFIGLPVNYRLKIREGRHRRDKEVIFDRNKNRASYIDYLGNERKETDVPAAVFDPISSFFYLRTLRLAVGESVYVSVFDSKQVWNVEVQVLRKEKVTIPMGTFDTIVVKPLMKSEGIFYRKGEIFIWLTDDAKHIPVKLQTKVPVGHITATLVKAIY